MKIKTSSTITCPMCGHQTLEKMPEDCCVFCSYGDTPCSPVQTNNSCC